MSSRSHQMENQDRISLLPDEILHHIFSSIDMLDIVRTSILSNRWRNFWLSIPNLNFNLDYFMKDGNLPSRYADSWDEKVKSFIRFVDRVVNRVLLLEQHTKTFQFKLYSSIDPLDQAPICSWIMSALRRNVQELCLDVNLNKPIDLPEELFTSNSLRVLRVLKNFKLPSSICRVALLKSLFLDSIKLPDGNDANGELCLSCPVLESLSIRRSFINHLKVLTVDAPLLEHLELSYLVAHKRKTRDHPYTSCKVKVFTPNLKSLVINFDASADAKEIEDYSLECCSSVVNASFLIDYNESTKKMCSEWVVKILHSAPNVQSLELSYRCLQALSDNPEALERLPDLLHNLRSVKIFDKSDHCYVRELLDFLERFPSIKTLTWSRSCRNSKYVGKWRTTIQFQKILGFLKNFEICNTKGTEVELAFMELLLERAVVLKKILIKYDKWQMSGEKLIEFKEKLISLPRASTTVEILFQLEGRKFV